MRATCLAMLFVALPLVLAVSAAPLRGDEPSGQAQPKKPAKGIDASLDEQLLDSLKDELLDGLDLQPKGSKKPPQTRPDGKPLKPGQPPEPAGGDDAPGARSGDAGEDIGAGEEDPLAAIGQQMRAVEQRIAQLDPAEQTQQLQEQIVAQLDELMRQLKKNQKQPGGSSSSQGTASRRSKVNQPGKQPGSTAGNPNSNRPARDSTDRLGPDKLHEVDMTEMQSLLKDLWGQLPPRAREQMLQSSVEQFLPKYQVMIEKYFRRLAEDSTEGTSPPAPTLP